MMMSRIFGPKGGGCDRRLEKNLIMRSMVVLFIKYQ
jgi:hypothetical protein